MTPRPLALLLAAVFACSSPPRPAAVAPPAAPPAAVVAPPAAPPAATPPAADTSFPAGWIGVWRGPLQIEIAGKPPQTMSMELHITPLEAPGRWTFRIVYNGQPRDYVLIAVDAPNGLYQVDEQNSIVIDAKLAGDTLLSQFSVQNNFVQARYHRVGATLELEILMVSWKSPNKTGGANGVPEVQSFPIRVVQRATLTR
jgi:hypothetical protein